MIHFDFIVDDIDAENIMYCMQRAEDYARIGMLDTVADKSLTENEKQQRLSWYREHIAYMKELIGKMKNTQVED